MPKLGFEPGIVFSMTLRYPRLTPEQREFAKKTIAARLATLGSDGTTFRPGSIFYIAMNAGLQAGNGRLDPAHRIDVNAVLSAVCQDAHLGIQKGQYVYHLVDDMFYDLFLGDIQEEDVRFGSHGSAVHAAHRSFCASLDQDMDWINLIADEGEVRRGERKQ